MSRSRSRNRTFPTRFLIALSAPAIAAAAIAAGGAFPGSAAQPVTPAHSVSAVQSAAAARAVQSAAAARAVQSAVTARAVQSAAAARAAGGHAVTAAESAALLTAALQRGHRLSRNEQIAWKMMFNRFPWRPKYQFRSLRFLWNRESGWRVRAFNPYSGAYGIPQAVPGSKMASAGPHWRYSARTQIRWGLRYIRARYGSPRRAWAHECAYGWY